MGKKSASLTFFKELPQNIFAGFVVSLVALPLALGLAIASEAPPLAGIIAAVIGGVVVAVFGGSHITISGPGNGLVIVLLAAITSLGGGDLYQGYPFTLAAIILSGGLLFLFGALRLGAMSEFFPASALQGMLAAIGVGILAKQFHVMLGLTSVSGDTIEQLMRIPDSLLLFLGFHPFAGIIGVISILFLFFYSKIRNPYFHLIPAPMWVVVGSIGVGYYYQLVLKEVVPIAPELLIKIPEKIISALPRPNFEKLLDLDFLGVVVSITLIAVIESLLSIKAVDKLDLKKRRSNVNKDLRALGLASIISGFLGGLNVVTVIARSSVNANNGGTNRSSNFFHAIFLVLCVVFLGDQIHKPYQNGGPMVYFGGYSPSALELCAEHCDVYLMWPETEDNLKSLMENLSDKAAKFNREIDFGLRVHVVVRETEEEAREYANSIISKLEIEKGTEIRERALDSKSLGVSRQKKMRDLSKKDGYIEPNLWTGIGKGRSGCGAAIVGNPDQIINKLNKYMKMGIRSFILSGYPHKEECKIFAKLVLPKLKTISLLQEQNKMPINEPLTPLAAGTRV